MEEEYPLAVMPDTKSPLAEIVDLVRAGRSVYDEVKGNKPPVTSRTITERAASLPRWAIIGGIVLVVGLVVGVVAFAFRKAT